MRPRIIVKAGTCAVAFLLMGTLITKAAGIVVTDEPYAASAGKTVLDGGGTAADAATATYFALSVTYPFAAGLGGGGICIVRDPVRNAVESLEFLPRNVRSGGAFAVPGNVRGMAVLHSRYGRLPWQSLVAKAERMAMLGFPMSHMLAMRIAKSIDTIRLDASLAKIFFDEFGRVRREGEILQNQDLAGSLAAIRTIGPTALYGGELGRTIISYTQMQKSIIADDEIARYAPVRTPAQSTSIGDEVLYFPSNDTGAGRLTAKILANLAARELGSMSKNDVVTRTMDALREFGVATLPNDLGATSFASVDDTGQAVSCAVTMSGPFGTGRTVDGTGITLANAPANTSLGLAVAFLTTIVATEGGGEPLMVGAGAGGPDATAAILNAAISRAHGGSIELSSESENTSLNLISCTSSGCEAASHSASQGVATNSGHE